MWRPGRWRGVALAILAVACDGREGPAPAPDAEPEAPASSPLFHDATRESGLDFVHDYGGTGELYLPEIMGPGGALFDYDGDGDLDLYCVQGGPVAVTPASPPRPPDRLYRNDLERDGQDAARARFTDVTAESGIRGTGHGMGVAAADYDDDGDVDLYLANFGPNQLWRNRGDGTFEDVTVAAGAGEPRWSTSASWLDFDRDGHLDLFVVNYLDFRVANHQECTTPSGRRDYCGPTTYRGEPDRLLRNRGDGTFEDVSGTAGILGAYGNGLGVLTSDVDGDGWVDVYVANDRQVNFLWMNRRDGTFDDEALLAGAAVNMEGQPEASMGVDAGDFDEDGDEDLFVTHLTGETNTFYRNEGRGLFEDRSNPLRLGLVSLPFTGFGTAFFDYDGDGWLDLMVANGAVAVVDELAAAGAPFPYVQTNQLFRNRGDRTYEDATAAAGPAFEVAHSSRGTAFGDVDEDGDTDLVVFNTNGPARYLRNEVGSTRPWAGLRLLTATGRDALGARVEVELSDGTRRWR